MISKGTFGEDENGNEPAAFSKLWIYEKGLNLIGASGFVPIITTLLSVMGCDYAAKPPVVLRDEDIVCWEGMWFLVSGEGPSLPTPPPPPPPRPSPKTPLHPALHPALPCPGSPRMPSPP